MEWTISHISEGNIIHIETSGTMTLAPLNQMVTEAMEAGERHNSMLYLVDHRNVLLEMDFIDTFERPKELDRIGFPRHSRIAQVFRAEDFGVFKFLETVSLNSGYEVRIFEDIALAKEWLNSEDNRPA